MSERFQPCSLPALIGSLPFREHQEAMEEVLRYTPEIPLWVQLPLHRKEGMIAQFLTGMPGYRQTGDKDYVDTEAEDFEQELLSFYEEYVSVTEGGQDPDNTRFRLDEDRTRGFSVLLETLRSRELPLAGVKGQITGPITFATGLKDQSGKAVFYDENLRDAAVKLLALKAGWQARKLSSLQENVLLFFDEPALVGFGSSEFISITKQDVLACFSEVMEQVHEQGGLTGVHVCANADWSLVLDSNADILSFDAYSYFDKLLLYSDELKLFLQQGRILAWGMIPTQDVEDIQKESVGSLEEQFWPKLEALRKQTGLSGQDLLRQSLITPSCGTGSLSSDYADKVLQLTRGLSDRISAHAKG